MYNTGGYSSHYPEYVSECGSVASVASLSSEGAAIKKRLPHYGETAIEEELECQKNKSSAEWNKRQNHSEIEKRRRDKMNTYICELSRIIPQCRARKLDKLSVLRLAAQHVRLLRGSLPSYSEGHYKPTFLPDADLQQLLLQQSSDGFLFVVGCDRGRILYVSDSVSQTLHYSQCELLGSSWFDILHPKDLSKVKEQLSCADISRRERLVDAKTLLPVHQNSSSSGSGSSMSFPQPAQDLSRLCPGSRRSFWCRIRGRTAQQVLQEEADSSTGRQEPLTDEGFPPSQPPTPGCGRFTPGGGGGGGRFTPGSTASVAASQRAASTCDRRYIAIHFTGYLKTWTGERGDGGLEEEADPDASNLACLVAVGRALPAPGPDCTPPPLTFTAKLTADAKFSYIDQRASLVLGWLPQELLGQSLYEVCQPVDAGAVATHHRALLARGTLPHPLLYRFRHQSGAAVRLQSWWTLFRNPWTQELEYIITRNTVMREEEAEEVESSNGLLSSHPSTPNHRAVDTRNNTTGEPAPTSPSRSSSVVGGGQQHQEGGTIPPPLSDGAQQSQPTKQGDGGGPVSHCDSECGDSATGRAQYLHHTTRSESEASAAGETTSDSDEAAMAVIMSLLEADAGLGGPVDFSHLPWPLP